MEDNKMSRETMKAYVMVAIDKLEKGRDFAYKLTEDSEEVSDVDVYNIISFISHACAILKETI